MFEIQNYASFVAAILVFQLIPGAGPLGTSARRPGSTPATPAGAGTTACATSSSMRTTGAGPVRCTARPATTPGAPRRAAVGRGALRRSWRPATAPEYRSLKRAWSTRARCADRRIPYRLITVTTLCLTPGSLTLAMISSEIATCFYLIGF